MRQHSCHSAAARSAAGAPADGAGWRAERPRARRVAAAGCRGARSPRARTPPCWHTHACLWPNARLPLTGAVAIAAQVAGVRARLATAERARARPRGAPAPAGVRALTTESPTTHTTDQHHVPIDPRAAELMPIHAARLALTRSVTQKAVDPSMGPALRVLVSFPMLPPLLRREQRRKGQGRFGQSPRGDTLGTYQPGHRPPVQILGEKRADEICRL